MVLISPKKALKKPPKEIELINISKTTTEEIENRYKQDFLKTTIENSKHKISINSKAFYSYFETSNLYEIYFIENYSNKNICLPFVLYELHNKDFCELFILEDFFALFQYGDIKLFKRTENKISKEEIVDFIKQRYKLNIDKIDEIDLKTLENLKETYQNNKNKKSPKLIPLKKDNSLNYLFSFILVMLLIPIIHFNFYHNENIISKVTEKKISTLEKKYNSLIDKNDKKKTTPIIETLVWIKKFTLDIKSINLKKDRLHIFLQSSSKSKLIKFVDTYKGNIKINKLTFNQQNKKFDLEALVVI